MISSLDKLLYINNDQNSDSEDYIFDQFVKNQTETLYDENENGEFSDYDYNELCYCDECTTKKKSLIHNNSKIINGNLFCSFF